MKLVVFGLSISSAWGNGHATLLRGLFRALHRRGHEVYFFERDVPYYAAHRDASEFPFVHLRLYSDWADIAPLAARELAGADVGIVTSYCADGESASRLVLDAKPWRTVFYDMDTPVTLSRLERGESVPYLPAGGLADFDLVLSYTGGRAIEDMRHKLGARSAATLYGWVDPDVYYRVERVPRYAADFSYLGTYSHDREEAFNQLFLAAANRLAGSRFVVGGAMYRDAANWPGNVKHFEHVAPPEHRAFYSSSPLTLNVTRSSMAAMGFCPSGRLFEAAACGTLVLSDWWDGLDTFFTPGEQILIAKDAGDTVAALSLPPAEIASLAAKARERTLDCHTADARAQTLLDLLDQPPLDMTEDLTFARQA
jgi:spore maturation protein CgeB